MRKEIQTTLGLLNIFYGNQTHFGKSYSWMSIRTIQGYLKKRYGIQISYRAVVWQLSKLKSQGLLFTFPAKYRRQPDGTIYAITPNRSLTLPGLKWLKRAGIFIQSWLWNHLTGDDKLPRGKGRGDGDKPPRSERPTFSITEGIRKLIHPIGKLLF